jgi:phosphoserine aminotransferase
VRAVNFAPGPAALPAAVRERVAAAIDDFEGYGVGILELFHRSAAFADLRDEVVARLTALLGLTEHEVLFMPGGARLQFGALPLNTLSPAAHADYVVTGYFGSDAYDEARRFRDVSVAWSGDDCEYKRIPGDDELRLTGDGVYVHVTSNNTEIGSAFPSLPSVAPGTWLAVDAASDLLTRRLALDDVGVLYATSHKNLGTAGMCVVLVRRDVLDGLAPEPPLPTVLDYRVAVDEGSALATPPVLQVFVLREVLRWLEGLGSLDDIEAMNRHKSTLLYDFLDASTVFSPRVDPGSRSHVNVAFDARTADLHARFLEEAAEHGLLGLAGYRRVGGLRASVFNAVTVEAVEALVAFMRDFERGAR